MAASEADSLDLCLGKSFESFSMFEKFLASRSKALGEKWKKDSGSSTVEKANRAIKDSKRHYKACFRYASVRYRCIHEGSFSTRGNRKRESSSHKIGCKAKFKLVCQRDKNALVITQVNVEHNHSLVQPEVCHYSDDRLPSTEEREEVVRLVELGMPASKIITHMSSFSGKLFKRSDIYNIARRAKKKHQSTRGDSTNNVDESRQLETVGDNNKTPPVLTKNMHTFNDAQTRREMHKVLDLKLKTRATCKTGPSSLSASTESSAAILTPAAVKLLKPQIEEAAKRQEKVILAENGLYFVHDNAGGMQFRDLTSGCTCPLYLTTGLPCWHLITFRTKNNLPLWTLDEISKRWHQTTPIDCLNREVGTGGSEVNAVQQEVPNALTGIEKRRIASDLCTSLMEVMVSRDQKTFEERCKFLSSLAQIWRSGREVVGNICRVGDDADDCNEGVYVTDDMGPMLDIKDVVLENDCGSEGSVDGNKSGVDGNDKGGVSENEDGDRGNEGCSSRNEGAAVCNEGGVDGNDEGCVNGNVKDEANGNDEGYGSEAGLFNSVIPVLRLSPKMKKRGPPKGVGGTSFSVKKRPKLEVNSERANTASAETTDVSLALGGANALVKLEVNSEPANTVSAETTDISLALGGANALVKLEVNSEPANTASAETTDRSLALGGTTALVKQKLGEKLKCKDKVYNGLSTNT